MPGPSTSAEKTSAHSAPVVAVGGGQWRTTTAAAWRREGSAASRGAGGRAGWRRPGGCRRGSGEGSAGWRDRGVCARHWQEPPQPTQQACGGPPAAGWVRHPVARSAHRRRGAARPRSRELRFNIGLLGRRLVGAIDWLAARFGGAELPIGLFGASTGAAAAWWRRSRERTGWLRWSPAVAGRTWPGRPLSASRRRRC
jgi:hypothetical protein